MAHFYGRMAGGRGSVTRTGTKKSGLSAKLKTWAGHVETRLFHVDGEDRYSVELYDGEGVRVVAKGTVS